MTYEEIMMGLPTIYEIEPPVWDYMFLNFRGFKCFVYYTKNIDGEYDLAHISMPMSAEITFIEGYSINDFVIDNGKRSGLKIGVEQTACDNTNKLVAEINKLEERVRYLEQRLMETK